MNERMIEELREESEKLHRQLEENPETWEELEEVSEEILPPEVSHLVVDFKKGQFDYQDYFRLSTEHRDLFRQYLKEHLGVKLTIEKPA